MTTGRINQVNGCRNTVQSLIVTRMAPRVADTESYFSQAHSNSLLLMGLPDPRLTLCVRA